MHLKAFWVLKPALRASLGHSLHRSRGARDGRFPERQGERMRGPGAWFWGLVLACGGAVPRGVLSRGKGLVREDGVRWHGDDLIPEAGVFIARKKTGFFEKTDFFG